ncbi:hypothetical protein [Zobellella iuensis]|uniref:GED domain-containing protein n=1 Tax=Zobellella iuensis TaxID=2803811 RepID=A0ABS1QVS9_9GAMM|nr:hypothetical protein [Zobellella iuensis]MBL1378861.1 hypothetical protein [Zobellella iuensis]
MREHLLRQQQQQLNSLLQQRDRLAEREAELHEQRQRLQQARQLIAEPLARTSALGLLNQGHIKQQLGQVMEAQQRQLLVAAQDRERFARLSRQQAGKVKGLELQELQRRQALQRRQQNREWENQLEWCLSQAPGSRY